MSGIETLDGATARRIRAMWATLAGADAFPEAGVQVVMNAASGICPSGWAGIVAIGAGILATAPSEIEVDALARALAHVDPAGDWAAAFRAATSDRRCVAAAEAGAAHMAISMHSRTPRRRSPSRPPRDGRSAPLRFQSRVFTGTP